MHPSMDLYHLRLSYFLQGEGPARKRALVPALELEVTVQVVGDVARQVPRGLHQTLH